MLTTTGAYLDPNERLEYVHISAGVRDVMGEVAFQAALAEGRAMTLEQAIEYALTDQPDVTTP